MSIDALNERIRELAKSETYQAGKLIEDLTNVAYEIMEEQGLTKAELAALLGTSRAWLTTLLSGTQNMKIRTAVSLFRALDHELAFDVRPSSDYFTKYELERQQARLFEPLTGECAYGRAA